ncbi:hypothetical protein NVP1139A_49 [Vibrio phage 1.139.A._10N.261.48.C6]|nr:hypothetical protein NVP1034X_49 [Vibrio phage 1.034.X._10N.261.46.B7]AUR90217.1 hypothetical protein NVP1139A_49 [Vibrio phage 1.139.A._10N.261.48.C6]AUR90284.1 hypothetical protein NVP1139B_49 [Vibrio phage 1.139.B._10N.261.48.C6]
MSEARDWITSHLSEFGFIPASFHMGDEFVSADKVLEICKELSIEEYIA